MKNVKKMEMNQFKFRRFWRLLRVSFKADWTIAWRIVILAIVALLAFRLWHLIFSDSLQEAFAKDYETMSIWPLYILFLFYFVCFAFRIIGIGSKFFLMHPATNLERFTILQVLPILYTVIGAVLSMFFAEVLWRVGLWLYSSETYAFYTSTMWNYNSERDIVVYVFTMLIIQYLVFFKFFYMQNNKIGMLPYIIVMATYLVLIGALVFGFHELGVSQKDTMVTMTSINFLFVIVLVIASYRGFCRYEPNLKKTSTE